MGSRDTTAFIVDFLRRIGVEVVVETILHPTVLPGIEVRLGVVHYDPERLIPGDLLHEVGHLAVLEPGERALANGNFGPDLEMAAAAWSYAAVRHLGLAPEVVFHERGYQGDAEWMIAHYGAGGGLGVPLLAWKGLTDPSGYPTMLRWLVE